MATRKLYLPLLVLLFSGTLLAQANQYKIYSNLGKRPNCYDTTEGWLIVSNQSIAMPFTPKVDVTLSEIRVPVVHPKFNGQDGFTLSVNEDSGGLPGDPVDTWVFKKDDILLDCGFDLARPKKGIPLMKGMQYWLVASASGDQYSVWMFTEPGMFGPLAYDANNNGWQPYKGELGAFEVLGNEF